MGGWQHQIPLRFKHFIVKKFRGAASFQPIADIRTGHGDCNPFTAKSDRVLQFGLFRMLIPRHTRHHHERAISIPAGRMRLQEAVGGGKIGHFNEQ